VPKSTVGTLGPEVATQIAGREISARPTTLQVEGQNGIGGGLGLRGNCSPAASPSPPAPGLASFGRVTSIEVDTGGGLGRQRGGRGNFREATGPPPVCIVAQIRVKRLLPSGGGVQPAPPRRLG
jgi:hypothetical protein